MAPRSLLDRDEELAALTQALEALRCGEGGVLQIVGEAGIGKSALLHHVTQGASECGLDVATASASDLPDPRPLGMLIDALAIVGRRTRGSAALSDMFDTFVRTARSGPTGITSGGLGPDNSGLERAVVALEDLVDALCEQGPVLLCLDDVQWAGADVLTAVGALARQTRTRPLLIVTARRPFPVPSMLGRLQRLFEGLRAPELTVRPLGPAAAVLLAGEVLGSPPGSDERRLLGTAGGNPFWLHELLRGMRTDPRTDIRDGPIRSDDSLTIPEPRRFLAGAVLDRVALDLTPGALETLGAASILGQRFTLDTLLVGVALSPDRVAGDLGELEAHGLIVADGPDFTFRHELLRETVEGSLPSSRRLMLHLEVGRRLARHGLDPAAAARHLAEAATALADDETIDCLREGAAALAGHAPDEAARLLKVARALVPASEVAIRRAIELDLLEALFWAGELSDVELLAHTLLPQALTPPEDAALRRVLARAQFVAGRPGDALATLTARRGWDEAAPASIGEAALYLLFSGRLNEAVEQAKRAVDTGSGGDEGTETIGWAVQSWVANVRGFHGLGAELGRAAVSAADRSQGAAGHRYFPSLFLALSQESEGETTAAGDSLTRGRELAESLGNAWGLPLYHYAAGLRLWNAGRWDDLLSEIEAGLEFAATRGVRLGSTWAHAIRALVFVHRGDIDAAREAVAAAREQGSEGLDFGIEWLVWAEALVFESDGRIAAGIDLLQGARAVAAALDAGTALGLFGPDLARLALRSGNHEMAEQVAAELTALAEVGSPVFVTAHAQRAAGLIGRDPSQLLAAREVHLRHDRPFEAAVVALEAAEMLGADGRQDDAKSLFAEVILASDQLGAVPLGERARHGVALLGSPAPARRATARFGWDSLTPAELNVVDLVALGMSNADMAAKLVLSKRTVDCHLYRIFTKLALRSRVELALQAIERKR